MDSQNLNQLDYTTAKPLLLSSPHTVSRINMFFNNLSIVGVLLIYIIGTSSKPDCYKEGLKITDTVEDGNITDAIIRFCGQYEGTNFTLKDNENKVRISCLTQYQ